MVEAVVVKVDEHFQKHLEASCIGLDRLLHQLLLEGQHKLDFLFQLQQLLNSFPQLLILEAGFLVTVRAAIVPDGLHQAADLLVLLQVPIHF